MPDVSKRSVSAAKTESLLRDMTVAMDFFGTSRLKKVDQILLRIWRVVQPAPEWLRGVTRYRDMPRVDRTVAETGVAIELILLDPIEIAHRINWVVETLAGKWCMSADSPKSRMDPIQPFTLFFASPSDVVYYKLRWASPVA